MKTKPRDGEFWAGRRNGLDEYQRGNIYTSLPFFSRVSWCIMHFNQYQIVFWISSRSCFGFWPQLIVPKLKWWARNKFCSDVALTAPSWGLNKPKPFYWLRSSDLFHSNSSKICAFACSEEWVLMSLTDVILWGVFLFSIIYLIGPQQVLKEW